MYWIKRTNLYCYVKEGKILIKACLILWEESWNRMKTVQPAAYRELREETGVTDADISLTHLMDLTYFTWDLKLEVFFGWLNKSVSLKEEVNELLWVDKEQNYFDMSHFAGEGNMGHIMEQIKQYEEEQAFSH